MNLPANSAGATAGTGEPPKSESVRVMIQSAPRPGEYRFYCAVPGHFDMMKGTLIVQ